MQHTHRKVLHWLYKCYKRSMSTTNPQKKNHLSHSTTRTNFTDVFNDEMSDKLMTVSAQNPLKKCHITYDSIQIRVELRLFRINKYHEKYREAKKKCCII